MSEVLNQIVMIILISIVCMAIASIIYLLVEASKKEKEKEKESAALKHKIMVCKNATFTQIDKLINREISKKIRHSPPVQYKIAELYYQGTASSENREASLKWAKMAYSSGNSEAALLVVNLLIQKQNINNEEDVLLKSCISSAGKDLNRYKQDESMVLDLYQNLGDLYFDGKYVEQNYQYSILYYEKAAKQNRKDAKDGLIKIGLKFGFYKIDFKLIEGYLFECVSSSQISSPSSLRKIADAYLKIGSIKHYFYCLGQLAALGDAAAQYKLATNYKKNGDWALYRKWLESSAKIGHNKAIFQYACLLQKEGEIAQAKTYFALSVEQGNAKAAYELANIFLNEVTVGSDSLAFQNFEKSAELGNSEVLFQLAKMHEQGIGTLLNLKKAADIYEKMALNNHDEAQATLASMYYLGKGQLKNYGKAKNWALKSANQGNTESQLLLGLILLSEECGTQDFKQAAEWIEKAYKGDHPQAMAVWDTYELWKYIG